MKIELVDDELQTIEVLVKKGKVVKSWKRRWVTLFGTCILYYKKMQDSSPLGCVLLKDSLLIDATPASEATAGHANCFLVETPRREYIFRAESGQVLFSWVQTLRSVRYRLVTPGGQNRGADVELSASIEKLHNAGIGTILQNQKTPNTFLGTHCVDILVDKLNLTSRREAIGVGQKLVDRGYIIPTSEPLFKDDFVYYSWNE